MRLVLLVGRWLVVAVLLLSVPAGASWTSSTAENDTASGEELLMPTGYDDFTERAGHDFQDLPEEAIRNRDLLPEVMESHDFEALPTEWWHYDCQGWERFEVLDLPLDSIPEAAR